MQMVLIFPFFECRRHSYL